MAVDRSLLVTDVIMPRVTEPKALECTWRLERAALARGYSRVAGCDEAGRGALIGPLAAAAVILDPGQPVNGLDDSKKLSPRRREELALEIRAKALDFCVAFMSAKEVDELNVYQASRSAMMRCIAALTPPPEYILTDAMPLWIGAHPATPCCPLIHGDARSVSIAAASILAKVARDARMCELDRVYPQYNLAKNKGYGTPEHLERLTRFGPCPEHRRSFRPVSEMLLPHPDATD